MKYKLVCLFSVFILFFSCKENDNAPDKADRSLMIKSTVATKSGLGSWQDLPRKQIEDYVKMISDSTSKNFIPVSDRIAVFETDGTLWSEKPIPLQAKFIFSQLKQMSAKHPEWKNDPVLNGILNDNLEPLRKSDNSGVKSILDAIQIDQTDTEYTAAVNKWMSNSTDKKFAKPYKQNVYAPMVELLKFLHKNDFKTFLVSNSGTRFIRAFSEEVFGIPPYQIIASRDDDKVASKELNGLFVGDSLGKVEAIQRFIGKVPVFYGGSIDADNKMIQYANSSTYKSMILLIHHTDSIREFKYHSTMASKNSANLLKEAKEKKWMVINMQKDWSKVFAFEK